MTVGFEDTAYFVLESNPSSVNICVILNGTTEREVEVNVTAMDLSATSQFILLKMNVEYPLNYPNTGGSGSDFFFTPSILTFPAGYDNHQCISPSVLTDMILEINETYLLNLTTTDDDDVILQPGSTTMTIVNDDCKLKCISQ